MSWVTSSDRARLRGERCAEPLLQLRARDRVERGERLVEQQDGLARRAACGRTPRAGASRPTARRARAAANSPRPKRSNSSRGAAARLARARRRRSSSASAALSSAERHGSRRSRCGIRTQRQAARRRLARPRPRPARRRLLQAADQLEQGRLPAARRAHEPEHLAGGDRERHARRAPRPARRATRTPSRAPAIATAAGRRCACDQRLPRGSLRTSIAAPFAGITPQVRRVSAGRALESS